MPVTRIPKDTEQVSVTLPTAALDMIEKLLRSGLYGTTRGEVIRMLVLNRLEDLAAKGLVKIPKR